MMEEAYLSVYMFNLQKYTKNFTEDCCPLEFYAV
jgi:hypothetical protein